MMIGSFHPLQQLHTNLRLLTLLLLLGVGILIGFFPQLANGLECYDCKHGVTDPDYSSISPDRPPRNTDCIKPNPSKKVNRTTCADPNESCFTGHAFGVALGTVKVKLLFRQCFLPKTGQKAPDGCIDYNGVAFGSNDTVYWGERSLVPEFSKGMWEGFLKAAQAQAKSQGKQTNFNPDVDIKGTYCLCSAKGLCNDEPSKEFVDPNDKGQSPEQKAWPQLIFFPMVWIFVSSAFSYNIYDILLMK